MPYYHLRMQFNYSQESTWNNQGKSLSNQHEIKLWKEGQQNNEKTKNSVSPQYNCTKNSNAAHKEIKHVIQL